MKAMDKEITLDALNHAIASMEIILDGLKRHYDLEAMHEEEAAAHKDKIYDYMQRRRALIVLKSNFED